MRVRTAEVVAALSLATDLAMHAPLEHALRSTCYAMQLADLLDLDDAERRQTYYLTPLLHAGCTAEGAVALRVVGDDPGAHPLPGLRALNPAPRNPATRNPAPRGAVRGRGNTALLAAGPMAHHPSVASSPHLPREMLRLMRARSEVAALHAERLHLPPEIVELFSWIYERWDGLGGPARVAGTDVPIAVRVAQVARELDAQRSIRSVGEAASVLCARAGQAFDPDVVDAAIGLDVLSEHDSAWAAMLAAEPAPVRSLDDRDIDVALSALGTFGEMVSPYLVGHAAAVSAVAADAARRMGLAPEDVDTVRRAGLVHDVGRVAVPREVWERTGPLEPQEWDEVRKHARESERVFAHAPWLTRIGELDSLRHDRDAAGPAATSLPLTARLLAVADAYCAMLAERPHRHALTPTAAAEQLRADAAAGELDCGAVEAVLAAAGSAVAQRSVHAALTPGQTDVLRLLARDYGNERIAAALAISVDAVAAHVHRIFVKAGVTTRAAATLWAMQRGLLG